MKKLYLFILLPFMIFAGDDPNHTGELIVDLINKGTSWNVTFTATAVTERWDEDYYLTSEYENASVNLSSTNNETEALFDLIIDPIAGLNPIMALGKYKISAIEGGTEQAYFYMDWRTCDYDASPDVYFKYDVGNNHFRNYANTQTIDGSSQTVWDLVGEIDHTTDCLELYLTVSNQNDNPYLTWNAYHDSNILGYNIYKKITLGAGGNQTFTIFTTSTSYLDDDFEIDPRNGEDQVEYWIKAKISSSQVSLEGNHVQLIGDSYIQWKVSDQDINKDLDYNLYQNYPNPFNPSTNISYQLNEDGFVNLSIYNSIGETIAELVNQQQEQGNYKIEFNAVNLPSGIYFYKISTDKFTDVKKMILLR